MTSPFAIPPLPSLGRWATRKVHGSRRSSQGFLLTRDRYFEPDQEWRLGQAYLGMLGLSFIILSWPYVQIFHGDTGYHVGRRHVLGHWSDLPLDLKILVPLVFVGHLVGILSCIRAGLVWNELGFRDDIGE